MGKSVTSVRANSLNTFENCCSLGMTLSVHLQDVCRGVWAAC